MIERVVLVPEALADASEAYLWYEERGLGLGDRYLQCVQDCIDSICRNPELFEVVFKGYRRAIVSRFPYVIFCELQGDSITIYSVFHVAQDPKKWRERLG
jgi:plasmid stabilization system protein ParE